MQFEGMGKLCISNNLYWPTKGNFYHHCSSCPAPLCVRKALQEMSGYISEPATGFLSPPTSVLLIFPWSTALSLTSTALLTVSSTKYYWCWRRRSHEPVLESIQEDRKDITMSESILSPLDGAQPSCIYLLRGERTEECFYFFAYGLKMKNKYLSKSCHKYIHF